MSSLSNTSELIRELETLNHNLLSALKENFSGYSNKHWEVIDAAEEYLKMYIQTLKEPTHEQ